MKYFNPPKLIKAIGVFNLLLMVVCLSLQEAHAQQTGTENTTTWLRLKSDVHLMADGFSFVMTQPLRWQGKDWLKLGGVAAGVYLISTLDEPLQEWSERNNTPRRWESVENFADLTGKPGPTMIAFSAIYGIGVVADKEWMRESGTIIFSAVASTTLLQTILKTAVGRARPSFGKGNQYFKPFGGKSYHSFPSGHTVASMTITSVLAQQTKNVPLKAALYAVGIGTGLARVYNGAHWLSDVTLSGVASYFAVRTVTLRYKNKKRKLEGLPSNNETGAKLDIRPSLKGVHIVYTF